MGLGDLKGGEAGGVGAALSRVQSPAMLQAFRDGKKIKEGLVLN